ncbi:glycosyl hydrolase family 8, partial [Nostoc sp. NIES-2111]
MIRILALGLLLMSASPCAQAAQTPSPVPRAAIAREAFSNGWALWRSRFIAKDGRVVDTGNAGVSHSEGQGYGMLLAVLADDPFTFDRLWAWTRSALMIREDGLAAWRWDPASTPRVADMNNASDGDLLIAWALAEAARSWNKPEHRDSAARSAAALFASAVCSVNGERTLLPGAAGFTAEDRPDGR